MEGRAAELRALVNTLAAAAVGTDLEDTAQRAAVLAGTLASDIELLVATLERVVRPILLDRDPGRRSGRLEVLTPAAGTAPVAPARRDVG